MSSSVLQSAKFKDLYQETYDDQCERTERILNLWLANYGSWDGLMEIRKKWAKILCRYRLGPEEHKLYADHEYRQQGLWEKDKVPFQQSNKRILESFSKEEWMELKTSVLQFQQMALRSPSSSVLYLKLQQMIEDWLDQIQRFLDVHESVQSLRRSLVNWNEAEASLTSLKCTGQASDQDELIAYKTMEERKHQLQQRELEESIQDERIHRLQSAVARCVGERETAKQTLHQHRRSLQFAQDHYDKILLRLRTPELEQALAKKEKALQDAQLNLWEEMDGVIYEHLLNQIGYQGTKYASVDWSFLAQLRNRIDPSITANEWLHALQNAAKEAKRTTRSELKESIIKAKQDARRTSSSLSSVSFACPTPSSSPVSTSSFLSQIVHSNHQEDEYKQWERPSDRQNHIITHNNKIKQDHNPSRSNSSSFIKMEDG